jgi:hypothetical protein
MNDGIHKKTRIYSFYGKIGVTYVVFTTFSENK